ncbi:helix-turn-helix domain-containing protein [Diplocloster modestus]|uniref:AraC family transcriptional regulator n=1 Tax=Diplocloster modestus TaxID=2850322 RepID=A0ABS6KBB1_9FIRM|nr:AraC family transcriptional regulator [Diplocloster modestus]MBU9727794.1 AraC family transcriptional regulator [Diplocloster modestus]
MNDYFENTFNFSLPQELNMYYCGYRKNTYSHSYGPAVRDHYLIGYIKHGKGILYQNGKELPLYSQQLLVMFPHQKIHYIADRHIPWSIKWIGVYGKLVDSYIYSLGITPALPVYPVHDFIKTEEILDDIIRLSTKDTLADKILCIGCLHQFFSCIAGPKITHREDYVEQAVNFIKYNYDRGISASDIADSVGLERTYFSKIFKERTGVSPGHSLLTIRMAKAKDLLLHTRLTLKEISYSIGYKDVFYFSKVFKKYTGLAPSAYRKEAT